MISHKRIEAIKVTSFNGENGDFHPQRESFPDRSVMLADFARVQSLILPQLAHRPGLLDITTGKNRHLLGRMFNSQCVIRTFSKTDAIMTELDYACGTMVRDSAVMLLRAGEYLLVEAHLPWRGVAWLESDGSFQSTVIEILKYLEKTYQYTGEHISMVVVPGVRSCCFGLDPEHQQFGPNNQKILNFVEQWNDSSRAAVYRNEEAKGFDIPAIARGQALSCGLKEENILVPEFCSCCGAIEENGDLVHPFYSHTRWGQVGDEKYGTYGNASNPVIGWLG